MHSNFLFKMGVYETDTARIHRAEVYAIARILTFL
jgi:hypothetical protein